jgi:hypothetical protein
MLAPSLLHILLLQFYSSEVVLTIYNLMAVAYIEINFWGAKNKGGLGVWNTPKRKGGLGLPENLEFLKQTVIKA